MLSLSSMRSGHYLFEEMHLPFESGNGNQFDIRVDLDFDADVVAVIFSNMISSTFGTAGTGSGASSVPMASATSLAEYLLQFPYNESGSPCTPCNVSAQFKFGNLSGQIANAVKGDITVTHPVLPGSERASGGTGTVTQDIP